MPTTIEWTRSADGTRGETWNPTVGCSRVSPGCDACYAIGVAHRAMQPAHEGLTIKRPGERTDWTGEVRCLPERLDVPLRRKKPTTYFVDSMSDLFHPGVPDGYLMRVFDVMAQASWHTFQVLTKRPQRMASFLHDWVDHITDPANDDASGFPPLPRGPEAVRAMYSSPRARLFAAMLENMGTPPEGCAYPLYDWQEGMRWWPPVLPNVWWGTSIESDRYAFRADHLRTVPAAVRFLSLEPLLGSLPSLDLTGIDWVIVGGESGPGARPMHPDWVRDIRDQCVAAGVRFFFKQWGAWRGFGRDEFGASYECAAANGALHHEWNAGESGEGVFTGAAVRLGKKAAGALLDGREWREFPDGF